MDNVLKTTLNDLPKDRQNINSGSIEKHFENLCSAEVFKESLGPPKGIRKIYRGTQEESLFWSYFKFLDKIDETRDSFKVVTFFWPSLKFWNKYDKIRDSFIVITFWGRSSLDFLENIIARGPMGV